MFFLILAAARAEATEFIIDDIRNAGIAFHEEMMGVMPSNSLAGFNWSDPHIGQLFGVPPHAGIGVSYGWVSAEDGPFNDFTKAFGIDGGSGFALHAPLIEARIGGFWIPFDIGGKFGMFDDFSLDKALFSNNLVKSLLIYGVEFRYSLTDKLDLLPFPKVSVALSYNYASGSMKSVMSSQQSQFQVGAPTLQLWADSASLNYSWELKTIECRIQVASDFVFFTLYGGAGAAYFWGNTKYRVDFGGMSFFTQGGSQVGLQQMLDMWKAYGFSDIDVLTRGSMPTGFESKIEGSGGGARLFGGASFNFFVFKLDLSASVSVPATKISWTVGLRVQS